MMTRLRSRIYVSSLSPGSLKKRLIHCFECAPREFLFDISTLIKFGRSSSPSGNYAYRRPEVFCLSPSWIIAITYSSFISIRLSGPKIFLPNALFLLFSPANSKTLRAGKKKGTHKSLWSFSRALSLQFTLNLPPLVTAEFCTDSHELLAKKDTDFLVRGCFILVNI